MSTTPPPKAESRISRRAFLRLSLLGGIGAALAVLNKVTQPVGPISFVRWMARGHWKATFGRQAVVALGVCSTYQEDVLGCLRQAWFLAEMPDLSGARVLVKPNLVDTLDDHPTTTAPQVVAALVDFLRELGAGTIVVGDGPAFRRDAWPIARQTGLLEALSSRNVPFVDLNYDELQAVPVRDGWIRSVEQFWLPRQALEADFIISAPKMKCHHWAGLSLSMKNLLGVIPGGRYGWPKNTIHINGITATLLGVYSLLPPVLSVVDGIVGMEGDGPLYGTPVEHGLLAVGADPLAVDVTCASLMGFALEEVEHLATAAWAGIGQAQRVVVRGASPMDLQRVYQKPPEI